MQVSDVLDTVEYAIVLEDPELSFQLERYSELSEQARLKRFKELSERHWLLRLVGKGQLREAETKASQMLNSQKLADY
jgi:hypothetical protein